MGLSNLTPNRTMSHAETTRAPDADTVEAQLE